MSWEWQDGTPTDERGINDRRNPDHVPGYSSAAQQEACRRGERDQLRVELAIRGLPGGSYGEAALETLLERLRGSDLDDPRTLLMKLVVMTGDLERLVAGHPCPGLGSVARARARKEAAPDGSVILGIRRGVGERKEA